MLIVLNIFDKLTLFKVIVNYVITYKISLVPPKKKNVLKILYDYI